MCPIASPFFPHLSSYKLELAGNEGFTDDIAKLQKHAHQDIPSIKGFTHDKSVFYSLAVIRLICPRHLRDEFDKDPEQFGHDIQNWKDIILPEDMPTFLYPESGYDPEFPGEGLLRGPFLVSVRVPVICMCIANLFIVL